MNLTLKLAHDENEMNRVSALKIMNELASDMGQMVCESFIVPEIRSLSIDESVLVRHAVVKNFLNASKVISVSAFSAYLFPMYETLTLDKEEKVRKACAEVIAPIAAISPLEAKGRALQDIFFRFLKDAQSKVVRGSAYQNIGAFIANFKATGVDKAIVDFFVATTSGTSNKDVCYYSAYNLPAFVDVLGPDCWPRFRPIYMKLTSLKDAKILRTLGHSLHELARLLGPAITEADLTPVMVDILSESNLFKEAKNGALKNLHAFMADLSQPTRERFLPFILQEHESVQLDWREKINLAANVGNFCLLFDVATVFDRFLPLFF